MDTGVVLDPVTHGKNCKKIPGWLEGFVGYHSYNTAVVNHETHKPLEFLLSCRQWFLLTSGLFYLNVLFSKSNLTFDELQWKNNWFGDPVYLIIQTQSLWLLSDSSTSKQGNSQLEDDGSAVPFSTMHFISASITSCFSSDIHLNCRLIGSVLPMPMSPFSQCVLRGVSSDKQINVNKGRQLSASLLRKIHKQRLQIAQSFATRVVWI